MKSLHSLTRFLSALRERFREFKVLLVRRRSRLGGALGALGLLVALRMAAAAEPGSFEEWNRHSSQESAVVTPAAQSPSLDGISEASRQELTEFVTEMHEARSVSRVRLLKPSFPQADGAVRDPDIQTPPESVPEAPSAVWWDASVRQPMQMSTQHVPVSLESILVQALDYSTQIKVYSDLPMIRQTAIVEADAAFDSAVFLDSRWDDQNDPVGNTLTTGGANRYKNNQLSTAAGVRKRTETGGRVELSQRVGFQDTNSTFFVPDQQGTAKLVLNYTQPLMRGRGCAYNRSLTVLAQIDKTVAEEEFSRQLQSHLLEVFRSYWGLYLERSLLVQKQMSLERAEATSAKLQERAGIDAVKPQLQRAAAEVATRQSELIRAKLAVKNAEARIRALVNDPSLGDGNDGTELVPVDPPLVGSVTPDLSHSLLTALQIRPEVKQALEQIKAGAIRQDIAKNELMPALNLITEAYLSGLQNEGSIGDAFTDQFHVGGPGYSVGLQFEVPLHNRAARSRRERRQIELRQLQHQYQTTVQTLSLEVEVAVRELETTFQEMNSQKRAVEASAAQLDYLEKRWELLPGDDGNGALMLDNLLTAQERLGVSENAYTQVWITYNLAIINHQRATGELLTAHQIAFGDYVDECEQVPTRMLVRTPALNEIPIESSVPMEFSEPSVSPDSAGNPFPQSRLGPD